MIFLSKTGTKFQTLRQLTKVNSGKKEQMIIFVIFVTIFNSKSILIMKKPKQFIRSAFIFILVISFSSVVSSCKKEDDTKDLTTEITTNYNGVMNVAPGFQSDDYTVTVSKISNNRIKITPEDNNASSFEVDIKEGSNGVILSDDSTIVIQFSSSDLNYTYLNSNSNQEQFSGSK